jgi:hypothetical protein
MEKRRYMAMMTKLHQEEIEGRASVQAMEIWERSSVQRMRSTRSRTILQTALFNHLDEDDRNNVTEILESSKQTPALA